MVRRNTVGIMIKCRRKDKDRGLTPTSLKWGRPPVLIGVLLSADECDGSLKHSSDLVYGGSSEFPKSRNPPSILKGNAGRHHLSRPLEAQSHLATSKPHVVNPRRTYVERPRGMFFTSLKTTVGHGDLSSFNLFLGTTQAGATGKLTALDNRFVESVQLRLSIAVDEGA